MICGGNMLQVSYKSLCSPLCRSALYACSAQNRSVPLLAEMPSDGFVEEFDTTSDDEAGPAVQQYENDGSFLAQFLQQQQPERHQGQPGEQQPPEQPEQRVLHSVTVSSAHAGARLAKFTSEAFQSELQWGRNRAAACARDGRLRVNGEASGANRPLQAGDVVTVHARPPCTLTVEEIVAMLRGRCEAKAAKDYETADSWYSKLQQAGVSVQDKQGTWSTPEGRSGAIPTAQPNAAANGARDRMEMERRRLRNKKKREAKERKAERLAAADDDNEGTAKAPKQARKDTLDAVLDGEEIGSTGA